MNKFDDYIRDNYKKHLNSFIIYVKKKYKMDSDDGSDIFQDSIILIINSKSYINNTIKDPHSYLWIVLRNNTTRYLQDKCKKLIDYNKYSDELDSQEELDIDLGEFFTKDVLKKILDRTEYMIIINRIYNDLTYRQISNLIGYSPAYVYKKNKDILQKLLNEINENKNKYYK